MKLSLCEKCFAAYSIGMLALIFTLPHDPRPNENTPLNQHQFIPFQLRELASQANEPVQPSADKILWTQKNFFLQVPADRKLSHALIDEDQTYLANDAGEVYAIAIDGAVKWKFRPAFKTDDSREVFPTSAGSSILLTAANGRIYKLSKTGDLLASRQVATSLLIPARVRENEIHAVGFDRSLGRWFDARYNLANLQTLGLSDWKPQAPELPAHPTILCIQGRACVLPDMKSIRLNQEGRIVGISETRLLIAFPNGDLQLWRR